MAVGRNTLMDPPIEDLLDKVDSKFTLVALGSARARQVNSYYNSLGEGLGRVVPPQVTSVSGKPLSIAFEEIAAGKATSPGRTRPSWRPRSWSRRWPRPRPDSRTGPGRCCSRGRPRTRHPSRTRARLRASAPGRPRCLRGDCRLQGGRGLPAADRGGGARGPGAHRGGHPLRRTRDLLGAGLRARPHQPVRRLDPPHRPGADGRPGGGGPGHGPPAGPLRGGPGR